MYYNVFMSMSGEKQQFDVDNDPESGLHLGAMDDLVGETGITGPGTAEYIPQPERKMDPYEEDLSGRLVKLFNRMPMLHLPSSVDGAAREAFALRNEVRGLPADSFSKEDNLRLLEDIFHDLVTARLRLAGRGALSSTLNNL